MSHVHSCRLPSSALVLVLVCLVDSSPVWAQQSQQGIADSQEPVEACCLDADADVIDESCLVIKAPS